MRRLATSFILLPALLALLALLTQDASRAAGEEPARAPAGLAGLAPALPAEIEEATRLRRKARAAEYAEPARLKEALSLYARSAEIASLAPRGRARARAEGLAWFGAARTCWRRKRVRASSDLLHRAVRCSPDLSVTDGVAELRTFIGQSLLAEVRSVMERARKLPRKEARRLLKRLNRRATLKKAAREFAKVLENQPFGEFGARAKFNLGLTYEYLDDRQSLGEAIDHFSYICGGPISTTRKSKLADARERGQTVRMPGPHPEEQEAAGFVRPQWPWTRLRARAHAHIARCLYLRSANPKVSSADRERALQHIDFARQAKRAREPRQLEPLINLFALEREVMKVEVEHLSLRVEFYLKFRKPRAASMTLDVIEKRFDIERLAAGDSQWTIPEKLNSLRRRTEKKLGRKRPQP